MSENQQSPLDWLSGALEQLEEQGLGRQRRVRSGPQQPKVTFAGRSVVHFGSNDYLDLANDPRIVRAVCTAVERDGWGAAASPLISGHTEQHAAFAEALARFERTDAAVLFCSGFAANVGTIPAIVGPDDFIFADQKNHASLIDGCRLSGATIAIYRHGDVEHLETLLQQATPRGKKLIVTDSLFSMDGDFAPLVEIASLRERYGCMLLIDEAHATGVFGESGRGVAEKMGVESAVDIKIGTLSKHWQVVGGSYVVDRHSSTGWPIAHGAMCSRPAPPRRRLRPLQLPLKLFSRNPSVEKSSSAGPTRCGKRFAI